MITESPKLNIRLADKPEDLEFLRPLSVEFHGESRYSDIPYSHKKRDALFIKALEDSKRHALIIAEFEGEPVGLLYCAVGEYFVGTTQLITTVYSFYVRQKYRESLIGGKAAIRLMNGAVKWSKARDVREIMIHVTSGVNIQRTDKFLQRTGFEMIGGNYSFVLNKDEGDTK